MGTSEARVERSKQRQSAHSRRLASVSVLSFNNRELKRTQTCPTKTSTSGLAVRIRAITFATSAALTSAIARGYRK